MKSYAVSVDITMSKTIYVDAKDEESAKTIAKNADSYVSSEVVDVCEDNNQ